MVEDIRQSMGATTPITKFHAQKRKPAAKMYMAATRTRIRVPLAYGRRYEKSHARAPRRTESATFPAYGISRMNSPVSMVFAALRWTAMSGECLVNGIWPVSRPVAVAPINVTAPRYPLRSKSGFPPRANFRNSSRTSSNGMELNPPYLAA